MNRFFTLLLAASCLTAVGQVPDYVPTDGLVVWWNSGYSGITETSGAIPTAGRWGLEGEAMFFDGQDDFVLLNNLTLPQGDDQRTTSAWFNRASLLTAAENNFGTLVNYGPASSNERWFMLVRDNFLQIGAHNDDICPLCNCPGCEGSEIEENWEEIGVQEWYHAVATFDGTVLRGFINGQLIYSSNKSLETAPSTSFRIGYSVSDHNSGEPFHGSLQDVGVWDRALTDEEVIQLYNAPQPVLGCTNTESCNYNAEANLDDGSCLSCDLFAERCLDGTIWSEELGGCVVAIPSDSNFDGCVQLNDLLDLLTAYGDCGAEESAWQCGDPLEYQGYDYETVQIGEQCWFAENLRAANYRDDQPIMSNVSNADWITLVSGASTVYGGIEDSPCVDDYAPWNTCDTILSLETYGRLYNWFAVNDNRNLCPLNWHVPSNFDWSELTTHLGGENVAGVTMKTEEGWYVGVGGNNSSGFSAYPGGEKATTASTSSYHGSGAYAIFWSQTPDESNGQYAWQWSLSGPNSPNYLNSDPWFKTSGFSVRCIKD